MFDPHDLLDVDPYDIMWGSRGKDGKQPLRWDKLRNLATDHLEAILRTQKRVIGTPVELAIRTMLER